MPCLGRIKHRAGKSRASAGQPRLTKQNAHELNARRGSLRVGEGVKPLPVTPHTTMEVPTSTFTLDQFEIGGLEEQLQRKTNIPWKFTSCQCSGPDFIPIFCFSYEMEIGPEDQEFRSKVRVTAQSDARGGTLNLYAIRLEGDAATDPAIAEMLAKLKEMN